MAVSADYKAFVEELFEPVFPVRIRAMFGGAGVYSGDVMFALLADDELYLRTDEATAPLFEAEGCAPFTFAQKSGEIVAMSYRRLPERLFDEPEELKSWALRALDTALKAKKPKPRKKARKKH